MRRGIIHGEDEAELKLPGVLGELCVHSHLEQASCRACVEACPHRAWVIDEEVLGIDPERCDGCDLCVPACPQGAIRPRFAPSVKETENGAVAFAICEYSGVVGVNEGLMPCIHAIGMEGLLRLQRLGVTYLISACGNCAECERGGSRRLEHVLGQINSLFATRRIPSITYRELAPGHWLRALDKVSGLAQGMKLNRRAFLHKAMRTPVERVRAVMQNDEQAFHPPGTLLPKAGPDDLFPSVPLIDPARCDGCDACINLCPQHALLLDDEPPSYRIDASRCTNCGICTDVCERQAVDIRSMRPSGQGRIPLHSGQCRACGVEFHVPGTDIDSLCRICRHTNHHSKLFQVLD